MTLRAIRSLVAHEFRQQRNVTIILVSVFFIFTLIGFRSRTTQLVELAQASFEFLVPAASALACVAIISNDVRSGWLRTMLVRPITRQSYLVAKIIVTLSSIWIILLINPNIIEISIELLHGNFLPSEAIRLVGLMAIYLGESLMYVAILIFLSCWFPSWLNLLAFGAWAIGAKLVGSYLTQMYWNSPWAYTIQEFLFPNGFSDAAIIVVHGDTIALSPIAWGIAATGGFLALAFWSFGKIPVQGKFE